MIALRGIVRWFDERKGIGFIDTDDEEYFVHYRSIKMSGFKTLKEGQKVVFMGEQGSKGWFANEIIVIAEGVAVDLEPS